MTGRKLSRRDFLKTALTGTGLLSLDSLLASCGFSTGELSPTYTSPGLTNPTASSEVSSTPIPPTETAPIDTPTNLPPTETPPPLPDIAVTRGGEPEDLVRRAVEAIGGMGRFVKQGDNVVVKPNICVATRRYDYAATTNPWVVAAVVKMAFEAGAASVKVMDAPFYGTAVRAYADSGIKKEVEAVGGEMVNMLSYKYVPTKISSGLVLKSASVYEDILNADVLINVPIAKNHESAARLTLGLKNLMGVVFDRNVIHADLVKCIADLGTIVHPQLNIIDAVRVLMDNGPRGYNLTDAVKMDTVIVSTDIVAADSYATGLFGMVPTDIAYLIHARDLGIGRIDFENMNIEEISLS